MSTRLKTTYSPINHHKGTKQRANPNSALGDHVPNTVYLSRYQDQDQDPSIRSISRSSHMVDYDESHSMKATKQHHHDSQFNENNNSIRCKTPIDEPELVYVSDCCCLNGELRPAYQHLGSLSSLFNIFNFFLFAFGLASLGVGLWFRIDPKVYEIHKYIETQNFTYAGWILLFGGFSNCIFALVGFAAVNRQSQCLLAIYMSFILCLSISFIGALVLLVVHGLGSELEQFLNKEIYEQMRRRTMSHEIDWIYRAGAAQFLDFIQVKMNCCGAVDWFDYGKLGLVVPTTCYSIPKNYINGPGCGRAIRIIFDIRAGLAVGFASGSILCQMVAFIMALLINCSIYQWRSSPRPLATSPRAESPNCLNELAGPPLHMDRQPVKTFYNPAVGKNLDNCSISMNQLDQQIPRSRTPIIMR